MQGSYSAVLSENNMADEFEVIHQRVRAFAENEGRRPRILVAKMGQDGTIVVFVYYVFRHYRRLFSWLADV